MRRALLLLLACAAIALTHCGGMAANPTDTPSVQTPPSHQPSMPEEQVYFVGGGRVSYYKLNLTDGDFKQGQAPLLLADEPLFASSNDRLT